MRLKRTEKKRSEKIRRRNKAIKDANDEDESG